MTDTNPEIGSNFPPRAAEVEPPASVVPAGGSIDDRSDLPVTAPMLKPCPFCSAEAKWIDDNGELDTPFGLVVEHSESCFLGPRMMADWSGIILAWNRRAAATDHVLTALSESSVTGLSLDSSTLCITLRFDTYEQASKFYVRAASAVGVGVDSATAPDVAIWSGEHRAYWRRGSRGEGAHYTLDLDEAGIWSREDAERLTSHCGPDKLIALHDRPSQSKEHTP